MAPEKTTAGNKSTTEPLWRGGGGRWVEVAAAYCVQDSDDVARTRRLLQNRGIIESISECRGYILRQLPTRLNYLEALIGRYMVSRRSLILSLQEEPGRGRSRPTAPRHQHEARSKHTQVWTRRARDAGGGRSSIAGSKCGGRAALPTSFWFFIFQNGLKSSDSGPNIDRMFADARTIYRRPVYELCDLEIRLWKIAELGAGFGALRTSSDPCRIPGKNAVLSSQRNRVGYALDMWRPL